MKWHLPTQDTGGRDEEGKELGPHLGCPSSPRVTEVLMDSQGSLGRRDTG